MNEKKALLSLLAGAGLIRYSSSQKGSRARLTTMGAQQTWRKESMTYQQKNIILLAIREAVQNSLDAVKAAIANGSVLPADAFIAVHFDIDEGILVIDDTGIGMDVERAMKFITLHGSDKGTDAQASGGWGVAKAVIFTLSSSLKANFRTQDINVPVEGFAKPGQSIDEGFQTGLPYLQGTRLTIYDVDKDEIPYRQKGITPRLSNKNYSHLFANEYVGAYGNSLYELIFQMLGSVGTDIPIYFKFGPADTLASAFDQRTQLGDRYAYVIPRPEAEYKVNKIFDVSKMTRIDVTQGRKSRKKTPDVLYEEDNVFLKTKIYLSNITKFPQLHQLLESSKSYVYICVRLNDMFMFFTRMSVQSKGLQNKIMLYDLYTNIRPYQEEVYPVSKTRENLTGKAKSVIENLIRQMNKEAMSAGADFEAKIIQPSNLDGLVDFQNYVIKSLFERADIPNSAQKNIVEMNQGIEDNLNEDNKEVERIISGGGGAGVTAWRMEQFRKKNNVQGSSLSSVPVECLPNVAPMVTEREFGRNDYRSGNERFYSRLKAQNRPSYNSPKDSIDIFFDSTKCLYYVYELLMEHVRPFFEEYTNLAITPHFTYINQIIRAIGHWQWANYGSGDEETKLTYIWSLFVRGRRKEYLYPSLRGEDYDGDPVQFYLVPPIHLILLDVRDVILLKTEFGMVSGQNQNVYELKRDRIVAQLNFLIAGFSNPSSVDYLIDSYQEGISSYVGGGEQGYFGWDETRGRLNSFSMHKLLRYENAYFYGLSDPGVDEGPAFWWPKLALTTQYFPADKTYSGKDSNSKRMFNLINAFNRFEDLRDGSRDLIGAPVRIKYNDDESLIDSPFALRTTYLGCQLITMLQGMYTLKGKRQYPKQFWNGYRSLAGEPNHGYTLAFITYFYDMLRKKKSSRFSFLYHHYSKNISNSKWKAQAQSASQNLVKANQDTKKLFKLLPKKLKEEQELPLDFTINPFDGFGMVRYGITLDGRTIASIERNFMQYIPLLCCWSSLIGMIDAIAGNRVRITCGLAFEPQSRRGASDYTALAQSFGDTVGMLFLRPDYYEYTAKSTADVLGTRLFSVAVHEYCHIGTSGHSENYANLRDSILKLSLPYLPYILELISEQLGIQPPTQSAKITQLQAKLAIRESELMQSRKKLQGRKNEQR